MEKIKEIMSWVGADGLLHLLVCWLVILASTPMNGIWTAVLAAVLLSLGKEAWDVLIQKNNDKIQVVHDLICDAAGVLAGLLTITLWWIVVA